MASASTDISLSGLSLSAPMSVVKDVHQDDIHGMLLLKEGHSFVSGSKDGTVKQWAIDGVYQKTLLSATRFDYRHWVTAFGEFLNDEEGKWLSGSRDGWVFIWDKYGKKVNEFFALKDVDGHQCKQRNYYRVTCLNGALDGPNSFFVGGPSIFQRWNKDACVESYATSENDWIYCIHPLSSKVLAIVSGDKLSLWKRNKRSDDLYQRNVELWTGRAAEKVGERREYISSLIEIKSMSKLVFCTFAGRVQVYDMGNREVVTSYAEHEGRVWQVVNLNDTLLLSGADDRTMKVWDIRMAHSVHTIGGHVGRVSSILSVRDNVVVSGSCPDDVFHSREKAAFYFWDTRAW
jgi:WD40 repeat protein